jgi:hypothetical protein
MTRLAILGCALILCVACKSEDKAKPSGDTPAPTGDTTENSDSPEASTGKMFSKETLKRPCELLTTEAVASVSKVAADKIEQRASNSSCRYEWKGGNSDLSFIDAHKSVKSAKALFSASHKNMTGAEVKEVMDKLGAEAKAPSAGKGEEKHWDKSVDVATAGVAKSMAGGLTYEAVEGVGDLAAYQTTRHKTVIGDISIVSYANTLDVVTGNLSFSLTYSLDQPDRQGKMHKEEAIALAKLVLARLN